MEPLGGVFSQNGVCYDIHVFKLYCQVYGWGVDGLCYPSWLARLGGRWVMLSLPVGVCLLDYCLSSSNIMNTAVCHALMAR